MLKRYWWLVRLCGVTAAVFGAVMLATVIVGADAQLPRPRPIRDAGAWKLDYLRTPEQTRGITREATAAVVQFDRRSKAGILAYRDAVRQMAATAFVGRTTVPALVTFAKPLASARFVELMTDAGVEVKSFQLRTQTAHGQRATITGAPDGQRILDPAHVERFLTGGPAQRKDTLQGVFQAEIVVGRPSYEALVQNGQEVFLVDIMRAVAHGELVKAGIGDMPLERIQVTSPYWQMEDYGLVTK